jgi:hypothetical protein
MARCASIKADGGRCGAQAIRDSQWCFSHHPDYEEQRRGRASRGGKRGGRGRPMVEVAEIQGQLADLFTSVLDGVIDPRTGAVLAQIANARARVVETALKAREQAELEERLQELETLLATRDEGGSRSWG